jgi:hypothetical protein
MTNKLSLVEVLRSGRQADPDGVEVRVSRQAVEETADEIERLQVRINGYADANVELRALLREWLAGCPAPPEWHWSFNLNIRTVNLLGGTAHEPGPQYRKWPGEPPHCMSCDCGMTEEQKRTVPFSDYQTFHRALMAIVYESKSFTEAVRLASDALQRKETAEKPSPASLVGALQDKVHEDTGAVQAGRPARDHEQRECLAERLAGRPVRPIDVDDIGAPHLSEDMPTIIVTSNWNPSRVKDGWDCYTCGAFIAHKQDVAEFEKDCTKCGGPCLKSGEQLCEHGIPINSPSACPGCHSVKATGEQT